MRTPHDAGRGRRSGRRLTSLVTLLLLSAGSALAPSPSWADSSVPPDGGVFTVDGAGWGHGRGMSQYGAYGAAREGLSWKQILNFYYPHTTRVQQAAGAKIRVRITADTDDDLRVLPADGLVVKDKDGGSEVLPTGSAYRAWKVTRSGTGYRLSYLDAGGSWVTRATALSSSTWTFSDPAEVVTVWVPGGAHKELRGTASLVARGTGAVTVNRLSMEDYLKGVVPAEMPTSWSAAAVRAQAVAARSYAARLQSAAKAGTGYDICDTTSCQVYRGYASTSGGHRTVYETANGDAAVKATAGTVLQYGSKIVLTEFASSNGGATVASDLDYQLAKLDPYDDVVASNRWTRSVTAAAVAKAYPKAGTVLRLHVTERDGVGRWGGRVTSIDVVGSSSTVTATGTSFAGRLGLRSSLFTVSGAADRAVFAVSATSSHRAAAVVDRG